MSLPKLIVVLGPTACGKSSLGVELARHCNGEIVSADSRQVYRGLDLGTGKITSDEMEGIPHHMLDVVEPNTPYSVADFQRGAYAAIDGILSRGKQPLLVGGTGLYIRAVTQGFVFQDTPPNPALRAELEQLSARALYDRFRALTGLWRRPRPEDMLMRRVSPDTTCFSWAVPIPATCSTAASTTGSAPVWMPAWYRRWPPSVPPESQTPFWRDWAWNTATYAVTSPDS